MLGAVMLMAPVLRFADRPEHAKRVFLASIALLAIGQVLLLPLAESPIGMGVALLVFFTGFMVLEAALPAHVSRAAPAGGRGTAIAVYSTLQFVGAFCGGALGGIVMQHVGRGALLLVNLVMLAVWLAAAARMRADRTLSARAFPIPHMDGTRARGLGERLGALPGVREARVHAAAGVAYLKVETGRFDEQDVLKLIAGER
jgi:MFS family permease